MKPTELNDQNTHLQLFQHHRHEQHRCMMKNYPYQDQQLPERKKIQSIKSFRTHKRSYHLNYIEMKVFGMKKKVLTVKDCI